jgi:hypothetical protein
MLIVIAEKEELKLVEELGYTNYPILITGVGGVNVIRALKDIPKDTEILNIGYCGSNYYEVGTKVEISAVSTHHEKAFFEEPRQLLQVDKYHDKLTKCYTSTNFVTKTEVKMPCVFDMELAFIRAMFPNTKSIKVVSDKLNLKEFRKNAKS